MSQFCQITSPDCETRTKMMTRANWPAERSFWQFSNEKQTIIQLDKEKWYDNHRNKCTSKKTGRQEKKRKFTICHNISSKDVLKTRACSLIFLTFSVQKFFLQLIKKNVYPRVRVSEWVSGGQTRLQWSFAPKKQSGPRAGLPRCGSALMVRSRPQLCGAAHRLIESGANPSTESGADP